MHPLPCTSPQAADRGGILLSIARASIACCFGLRLEAEEQEDFLFEPGASFVTLQLAGKLRGCVGSLEATRTLLLDVKANAQAAAFRDPRFPPLAAVEFDRTRIEVSLLSALQPIEFADEGEAVAALQPRQDGVVLVCGEQRSTFLPQVWETIPQPRGFLAELKRKAGLSADFWADDLRLYRYTVKKWSEPI